MEAPQMVDMARTPEDLARSLMPMAQPTPSAQYPYGLSISLTHDELAKLGLDANCEVGDMLHLFAMAKVTNVNSNASESSQSCRIELQITHLAVESEDEENEEFDEAEDVQSKRASKRYRKDEEEGEEG